MKLDDIVSKSSKTENCVIVACSPGTYGINCESTCDKCLNLSCDAISGACDDGCEDWYVPDACALFLGT